MKYRVTDKRYDDRFVDYCDRVTEWHRYVSQYDDDDSDIYDDTYVDRILDSGRETIYVEGGVWA